MNGFISKLDLKKSKLPGEIKETVGTLTGTRQLVLNDKVQSSKTDLKKSINEEDEVEDIRDVIARKIEDKIDRNEKQINMAYWANVNNMGNTQITLDVQETLPEIYSIKDINVVIVMGRIVLQLGDQEENSYPPGSTIGVPGRTRMKVKNTSLDKTAILVMKI